MIVNEMFLDTASLRNSVVSRAKHLGYTPISVRGAKAYVDLTITPANTPSTIVIEKDTHFNANPILMKGNKLLWMKQAAALFINSLVP